MILNQRGIRRIKKQSIHENDDNMDQQKDKKARKS